MICSLLLCPAIIFGFIYLMRKQKIDIEKLKLQKELKELEIQKDELHIRLLQEENRKYDLIIKDKS